MLKQMTPNQVIPISPKRFRSRSTLLRMLFQHNCLWLPLPWQIRNYNTGDVRRSTRFGEPWESRGTGPVPWNALPSFRNATINNGGLKDACDTQVMVAAPKPLAPRDVRIYMPLVRSRRTFCLILGSIMASAFYFSGPIRRANSLARRVLSGLLGEDFLDFSGLAVIRADLQSVLQLFFGHVQIVGLQIGHTEMIVIRGIFRIALDRRLRLDGFLEQINSRVINSLLVIGPAQRVGGVR